MKTDKSVDADVIDVDVLNDPEYKKYLQLLKTQSASSNNEPSFWEIDTDEPEKSDECIDIVLSTKASAKIDTLMRKFTHMEWLAYLIGSDDYIEDIVIPKQEVTVVNVFVDKNGVNVPIVGVIHSHHDMGNNFSHTDDEYINANHNISLCVSKNGYNGQIKKDGILYDANVIVYDNEFDIDSFNEEVEANIKVRSYNYSRNTSGSSPNIPDVSNVFFDDESIDIVSNQFMESKNIVGLVVEYMLQLKDLSLTGDINYDEVEYMKSLIYAIGTDNFDYVESLFYDSDDNTMFSDAAVALIDEIDIFNDSLSNLDNIKLNELYIYLEELIENK